MKHDDRPEVLLERGDGSYPEPWYGFDVGFIERGAQEWAGNLLLFCLRYVIKPVARSAASRRAAWTPLHRKSSGGDEAVVRLVGANRRRMHASSIRKFTLLDAMILVAATAAGLGLLRMFLTGRRFFHGTPFQGRFLFLS